MTIEELNTQMQGYVSPELREFVIRLILFYADYSGIYQNEDIDPVISRIKQYCTYNEMGIPIYKNDVKIFVCDNMGKYYDTCADDEFSYIIASFKNPYDFADSVMNEFHRVVRNAINYLTSIHRLK